MSKIVGFLVSFSALALFIFIKYFPARTWVQVNRVNAGKWSICYIMKLYLKVQNCSVAVFGPVDV